MYKIGEVVLTKTSLYSHRQEVDLKIANNINFITTHTDKFHM